MIYIKAITVCFAVVAIVGCGSGTKSAPQTEHEQLLEHANAGEAAAQAALANAYRVGHAGVQQDYVEAAKWYRKAAEQGDASAQAVLGHLYRTGEGVQQDYAEAFIWDRCAAEQGIETAQRVVGHAYRVGSGVEQDSIEAFAWFSVAANIGDEDAIQARDEIKITVKPELLAEAESRAADYLQKYGRGKGTRPTIILKNNVTPLSSYDTLPELNLLRFPDGSSVDFPLTIKVVSPASSSEHTAGEKIEFTFAITNDSEEDYLIPERDFRKAKAHSLGSIQCWIERLGPIPAIPAIPARTGKHKHLYAAGGNTMITRKSVLKPGENESGKSYKLDTTGYPSGQYRYHIVLSPEFKPMATTAVDFSIK